MSDSKDLVPRPDLLGMQETVRPEDLVRKVRETSQQVTESAPSLLETIFDPGKKAQKDEFDAIKVAKLRVVRREMDGMINFIDTYLTAHENELKTRTKAIIMTTLTKLADALFTASEKSIASMLQTYTTMKNTIENMDGLDDDEKKEQLQNARGRLQNAQKSLQRAVDRCGEQLEEFVVGVVAEVKQLPPGG